MDSTSLNIPPQPSQAQQFSIRRVLLLLLIISLSASALIAIVIFLLRSFGSLQLKVLFTTFIVGVFSLTGLCSSALYDKKIFLPLAFSGLASSVVSFILTTFLIWEFIDFSSDIGKLLAISVILSISIAHSSLLFLIIPTKKSVQISQAATIVFIAIVCMMLILLVLFELNTVDEFYFRLLGVFAVLDILGTIITPILKKVNS